MYTDPEIIQSTDGKSRAYVKVYIHGQRYRFYNGKLLGINCNPNKAKTSKDRERALTTLCVTLRKRLQSGWLPSDERSPEGKQVRISAVQAVQSVLDGIDQEDLSRTYVRDLKKVGDEFLLFLNSSRNRRVDIHQINALDINDFLMRFGKSATYFMNKRRTLGAIFSRLMVKKIITCNPIKDAMKQKEKSSLHAIYTGDQLSSVLKYLHDRHHNLYLCALLMYGCFLRPHREIRKLKWTSFNSDLTSISLDGGGNKSKKIRTVYVPPYIRTLVAARVDDKKTTMLFATESGSELNECYFNTAFSRIKKTLIKAGVITSSHTLYSFRHTAAVNLYMKTKDLYKVQQAMGHSDMQVTLRYLKSLGVINALDKNDLLDNPEAN